MNKETYEPDRRPITSRDRAVSHKLANWLVEAGVSPNAISISGMVAGMASGVAFAFSSAHAPTALLLAGAVLMQMRLLANMLDGMVAVASGRASPLGELYNEVPDRVSDTAILVGAGWAVTGDPLAGLTAAIAALFTAYIRAQGKAAGAHQEFCGPLGKPQRMFLLTVAALYAALAPESWQASFHPPVGGTIGVALWVIAIGSFLTFFLRLSRIARTLRPSP
jgi:phosphatidylglycerophosphate synthase